MQMESPDRPRDGSDVIVSRGDENRSGSPNLSVARRLSLSLRPLAISLRPASNLRNFRRPFGVSGDSDLSRSKAFDILNPSHPSLTCDGLRVQACCLARCFCLDCGVSAAKCLG